MSKELPLYAVLLEDVHGYKKCTSETGTGIGKQFKNTTVPKGSLIGRLVPSDVNSIQQTYNCLVNYKLDSHSRSDVYLFVGLGYLYGLSGLQRDFMLGVDKPFARLEMLGTLEWIESLRKSSEVYVTIATIPVPVRGVVRFIGGLPGEVGRKFGIEITERRGEGTNDGTFKGLELFKCKKDCAVFVSMDKLTTKETASAVKVTEAVTSSPTPTTKEGLPIRLGDVVTFYDKDNQQHVGIVRWIDFDKSLCPDGTGVIGIESLEHLNLSHIPHNFKLKRFSVDKNSNHSKVFLPATFVQRGKCPPRKDSGVDNDSGNEVFEDCLSHPPQDDDNQPVSGPNKEGPAASKDDCQKHGTSKTRKPSDDIVIPHSENPYNLDIGSEVMYLSNHAVIKWVGALPGNKAIYAGIEMIDSAGGPTNAQSNGVWDDFKYFVCKPGKGRFVLFSALKLVDTNPPEQTHSNAIAPSHRSIPKKIVDTNPPDQTHSNAITPSHNSIPKEQNPHNLKVGSAVWQGNPPNYGVIKWIGKLSGSEEMQAGVEMEEEIEEDATDGTWEGKKYFECKEKRGVFVFVSALQPDKRIRKPPQEDQLFQPETKVLGQSNRPATNPTSQPDVHGHRHENPHNLEEGSAVQYGDPPKYGVIKWMGVFPDHRDMMFAGLDMEEVVEHYVNGLRKGVQYFKPQPGRGKFVKLSDLQPDQRFVDVAPLSASASVPRNDKLEQTPSIVNVTVAAVNVSPPEQVQSFKDFEMGSMIEHGNPPQYGVIRWIGNLPGHDELYAGVDMDEIVDGYSDGTWGGLKYFNPQPGRGKFFKLSELRMDERFATKPPPDNPLRDKLCEIKELVKPPAELNRGCHVGVRKGIQGQHNSCYLDATLYGMFAFSEAFDGLFLDEVVVLEQKKNAPLESQKQIQNVIQRNIVNPLRKHNIVPQEAVLALRSCLDDVQKARGLTKDEKDPEEFLNLLFKQIFHIESYLKLRRPTGTEEEFFIQLFVESGNVALPDTQSLLHEMFMENKISFAEYPIRLLMQMPRHGKKHKVFKGVIPSLELDVGQLCNASHPCSMCGRGIGNTYCQDCSREGQFMKRDNLSLLCKRCSELWHSNPQRQGHKVTVQKTNNEITAGKLQLLSVLCIETSHYVCFTRITGSGKDEWVFFDSMAERPDDANNIPEVIYCTDELEYVYGCRDVSRIELKSAHKLVRRFVEDAYLCIYYDPEGIMYQ